MQQQKEQHRSWLKQYQVQDLSRSIIRQFLLQTNLTETLKTFDSQDTHRYKKISKSTLIKMLSINNLVYFNKQAQKPFRSLLEVLVNYLRDKFKVKVQLGGGHNMNNDSDVNTKKTEISNMDNNFSEQGKKLQRNLNNTAKLKNQKVDSKHSKQKRPVTTGNRVNYRNVQNIYAQLEKEDIRQKQKILQEQQEKRKQQLFIKKRQQEEQKKQERIIQIQKEKKREQEKKKQQQEKRKFGEHKRKIEQQQRKKQEQQLKKKQQIKKQQQLELKKKRQQQQEIQRKKNEQETKRKEEQAKRREEQKRRIQEEEKKRVLSEQKKRTQEEERRKQAQIRMKLQEQQKRKRQEDNKIKQEEDKKVKEQYQRKKKQQDEQAKRKKQQMAKQQQKMLKQKQKLQELSNKPTQTNAEPTLKQSQQNQIKENPRMGGMRKLVKKKSEKEPQFLIQATKQIQKDQVNTVQKPTDIAKVQQKEGAFVLNQNADNQVAVAGQKPQTQIKNSEKNTQKKEQTKMVTMFGKKKKNVQQNQQSQPKKFKFDQNFVDQPLHAVTQKYIYQPFQLTKITIKNPQAPLIPYNQKQPISTKKYTEKSITEAQASQLKKCVFQTSPPILPKSWQQGFILSPYPTTPFGLQQIQGGPCGIIAAVQCYFLKHLLHLSGAKSQELNDDILRENCLVAAIADMIWKSRNGDKIVLALPPKSFTGQKLDISSFRLVTFQANTFAQAFECVFFYRSCFIGKANFGVAVLMYCVVMTKGIQKIGQQIDMPDNPLIGNHGHCTQQLVNLFITGHSFSNVFDGTHNLDSLTLKGIPNKSQFGFLTIFQTNNQIHVGKNLKNPQYPFWIICKQFHYHVIFANNYLIGENNNTVKFDIIYFDGLYNCADFIRITLEEYGYGEEEVGKVKDLPLIQQVMRTKWGPRKGDWNGSIKIL